MLIGRETVPTVRLVVLIPQIKNVFQKYGDKEFSRDQLSDAMGFKPESGGFAQKISDLQNYRLMQKNASGKFTLTPLCQKLFQTTEKEQLVSILSTVFTNVRLWDAILKKYPDNIDRISFKKDLIEFTGLDEVTANKRLDEVLQNYLKDLNYVKNPTTITTGQYQTVSIDTNADNTQPKKHLQLHLKENIGKTQEENKILPPIKWAFRLTSDVGSFQLDIYDIRTYNMAVTLLETIKNQVVNSDEKQYNIKKPEEAPNMGS